MLDIQQQLSLLYLSYLQGTPTQTGQPLMDEDGNLVGVLDGDCPLICILRPSSDVSVWFKDRNMAYWTQLE